MPGKWNAGARGWVFHLPLPYQFTWGAVSASVCKSTHFSGVVIFNHFAELCHPKIHFGICLQKDDANSNLSAKRSPKYNAFCRQLESKIKSVCKKENAFFSPNAEMDQGDGASPCLPSFGVTFADRCRLGSPRELAAPN